MNIANFVKNFAPVLLLTASACGHHVPDDPVDIIPADAQAVAVYDLRQLSHAAGSTTVSAGDSLSDGTALALKMFLPANLGTPVSQLITAAAEGFDTSRLVCFTAAGGYTVAAMKVTDADAVSGALTAYRDKGADFDGFDVYNVSRRVVALSESLCIIAPDAATIRDNLRTSDSRPISEITGIKEFTGSGDNAVSVALPARAVGVAGMQGAWLCTGVRFTSDGAGAGHRRQRRLPSRSRRTSVHPRRDLGCNRFRSAAGQGSADSAGAPDRQAVSCGEGSTGNRDHSLLRPSGGDTDARQFNGSRCLEPGNPCPATRH